MISIHNVSKSFSGRPALKDVSLELTDARTHVFLGSSGSGKSTLLKIIAGLVAPDEGNIFIGEVEMSSRTQLKLTQQFGYMLQEGGLFPHLTCKANVTLMARIWKWPVEKIEKRYQFLNETLNLTSDLLQKYPRELSGGERQRVALMRALFLDPPVVLLDEPLGAIDPLIRFHLQSDLKDIFFRLKKLVVFVTHDLNEAAFMGHSVSLFHEGRVVQSGPIDELWTQPKDPFVTEFVRAQRPYTPQSAT